MKLIENAQYIGSSSCVSGGHAFTKRGIHFIEVLIGVEQNVNIPSSIRSIHPFVLLCFDIGLFILNDQQEGVALEIRQFEFKPALGIGLCFTLHRADRSEE